MVQRIAIGMLGSRKDGGLGADRWERWRPTVALCRHQELPVDRYELLLDEEHAALAEVVAADIRSVSPMTRVVTTPLRLRDPWDFEDVFGHLHQFARNYNFDTDREEYLVHVNTGTHVTRISLFLLTESRHFPGKLVQSLSPDKGHEGYRIIDLDLSRYDRLTSRFQHEQKDAVCFLKSGIPTLSPSFNRLIERIEQVALASRAPLLLHGPTGSGKSRLARRIHELRRGRGLIKGKFVEVNCSTLRGTGAMSTLFGHVKGAFTGADYRRDGLLRVAQGGTLFMDEVGELGGDEQTMLLRALEEKTFLPVGSDVEVSSDFQLLCGTNRDLQTEVAAGSFREDLLARIDLWTFRLPGLRERPEDIEPNIDFELARMPREVGTKITFNRAARCKFVDFAESSEAQWTRNFRDLNGALLRMSTLAVGGRITVDTVQEEIARLKLSWSQGPAEQRDSLVQRALGPAATAKLDRFERAQLEDVLTVCAECSTLSESGRVLFAVSRKRKTSSNDAHRLRSYLERYSIAWRDVLGVGK